MLATLRSLGRLIRPVYPGLERRKTFPEFDLKCLRFSRAFFTRRRLFGGRLKSPVRRRFSRRSFARSKGSFAARERGAILGRYWRVESRSSRWGSGAKKGRNHAKTGIAASWQRPIMFLMFGQRVAEMP